MIGGEVLETLVFRGQAEAPQVWINCRDKRDTCAICVEDTPAARCIEPGDTVWWQSDAAFWTRHNRSFTDYKLKLVGFSGVPRPSADEIEVAYA